MYLLTNILYDILSGRLHQNYFLQPTVRRHDCFTLITLELLRTDVYLFLPNSVDSIVTTQNMNRRGPKISRFYHKKISL